MSRVPEGWHEGDTWRNLTAPMPVWVSREDADGAIFRLTLPAWLAVLIILLVLFNILLWGNIALYEAFQYIF